VRISFLGAARTVTGSQYLLQLPGTSALVDCGMYQGRDEALMHKGHGFAFDPAALDCVLLTHAHIDHSGLLPRLWKEGFRGRVFATSATVDLCRVMLLDSAKIQEEDANWELRKWRKGQQATPPPVPLYTMEDAEAVLEHFVPVDYGDEVAVSPGLTVRWVDAGHILGAASLEVWAERDGRARKIVFSGDIGSPDRPILRDPTYISGADFVIMESTYGNRSHPPEEEVATALVEVVGRAVRVKGHVIVPSFAVGRTQDLLYRLDRLLSARRIPAVPVFVDSPMAARATGVFEKHRECYDQEALQLLGRGDNPIRFSSLQFTQSTEQSRALNSLDGPLIIISASGMCTAGRIRHHLHHHLGHGNDTILFVGFQAEGTLGRILVQGTKSVKLFGRPHRVRATVQSIQGLSAHADQTGLLHWVRAIGGARNVFITHGEVEASLTFSGLLAGEGIDNSVPRRGETVDLLDEAQLDRLRAETERDRQRVRPR
jgi:metallo-beta-lactamase family protein